MPSPPEIMPKRLRSSSAPRPSGYASSVFRLAWIVPLGTAILAALLEWADKLPAWAQSPVVLSAAMFCGALIVCAYILSRGLAKVEVRGDPSPGDPRSGEPF